MYSFEKQHSLNIIINLYHVFLINYIVKIFRLSFLVAILLTPSISTQGYICGFAACLSGLEALDDWTAFLVLRVSPHRTLFQDQSHCIYPPVLFRLPQHWALTTQGKHPYAGCSSQIRARFVWIHLLYAFSVSLMSPWTLIPTITWEV